MITQTEKANTFRALHERTRAFIIPNPYDAGTVRLLAHLGFEALATTSAGFAFTTGKSDNTVDRERVLQHCADIAVAVDLPKKRRITVKSTVYSSHSPRRTTESASKQI